MLMVLRLRTICAVAALATSLAACAGTSEPARTATRGDSDTSTAEALVRIAHASLDAGDSGSALSMLKRAHEIDPSSATILAELGRTLSTVNAWTEAADAYRQAAALDPKDAAIRRGYGGALLNLDQLALAETEYRAALAIKEEPATLGGLGVVLDLQGRHDDAEAAFRKAYQLDPQNPAIRSNLALSLALWGSTDEAVRLLAPLAAAPNADSRQRQNLALVFGLAGDFDQAAALARLDLGESAVRNNLAYFETLRGLPPVMRVRAIMGAQTQPPIPQRKPIAEADAGGARGSSPSAPAERPPVKSPAPTKPTRSDQSARIPTPTGVTPPKPEKTAHADSVKREAAKAAAASDAPIVSGAVPDAPLVSEAVPDAPLVESAAVTTHIIVVPTVVVPPSGETADDREPVATPPAEAAAATEIGTTIPSGTEIPPTPLTEIVPLASDADRPVSAVAAAKVETAAAPSEAKLPDENAVASEPRAEEPAAATAPASTAENARSSQ